MRRTVLHEMVNFPETKGVGKDWGAVCAAMLEQKADLP
jgi:hypothetical protein